MNYAVKMAICGMTHTPHFMKICTGVRENEGFDSEF